MLNSLKHRFSIDLAEFVLLDSGRLTSLPLLCRAHIISYIYYISESALAHSLFRVDHPVPIGLIQNECA